MATQVVNIADFVRSCKTPTELADGIIRLFHLDRDWNSVDPNSLYLPNYTLEAIERLLGSIEEAQKQNDDYGSVVDALNEVGSAKAHDLNIYAQNAYKILSTKENRTVKLPVEFQLIKLDSKDISKVEAIVSIPSEKPTDANHSVVLTIQEQCDNLKNAGVKFEVLDCDFAAMAYIARHFQKALFKHGVNDNNL